MASGLGRRDFGARLGRRFDPVDFVEERGVGARDRALLVENYAHAFVEVV